MNQLTLSLDYTWNEKGMIKKKKQKRGVGKTKRKNEFMCLSKELHGSNIIYGVCSISA